MQPVLHYSICFYTLQKAQPDHYSDSCGRSTGVFVNKKVLQKGVKKVSTFNTQ